MGPASWGNSPCRAGPALRVHVGCPLDTAVGTMHGSYRMVNPAGEHFEATIAPFTLAEPFALN